MRKRLRHIFSKIMGLKLAQRMFLIYIMGGVLPMAAIGLYLITGTNQILVEQAENTEITELEAVRRQILELQNTMTTVSQYFYFDPNLEKIAVTSYEDYQDMVNDYKNYTAFMDYGRYYNNIITRLRIFFRNNTLKENTNFVVVDESLEQEEWYARVSEKGSGVVWAYLPCESNGYDYALTLTRMLKTKKGGDVGVLAIYLRPERFFEMIQDREKDTFIVLNGESVISSVGEGVAFSDIREFLPDKENGELQERITLDGREYVMTCGTVTQKDTRDYIQIVSVQSLDDILSEANRQNVKSVCLSCISVVFAVMMILLFSRTFGRRVEHFREQMQKASEGNFKLEESLGGSDEISQLYDYLSIMIWKIQKLLGEIYQERIHAEQLKTKQKDAEFKMLTSQINPHFLYNTLETIRMKARVNRQYEIEELVKMLAKILRSSIQAGENDVPVKSEVELVEYYLKIQQYRFGERIQYNIFVEPGVNEHKILPLILQPVVENCIIHGLENKEDVGHIDISVRREGDDIVITVLDDGLGIGEEKLAEIRRDLKNSRLRGKHIGICNVHQRVQLKYGESYGVSIESIEGERTKVVISLPGKEKGGKIVIKEKKE